ncbi:TetR family transcriptional regulator [Mycobacteroides chelonae]|jgi:AcrR family transcriptional regulator|uniref:TetR/AcrR family transcriptional regulator n=1 Tax=Mycobacteroides chelonae TaxID=1774 RepID=UPI0008A96090|nr:TetR/AcrR family transcriptional regulator [Mycobacteroides chelonae]MBF9521299.1 TetR/AcrR family transcriptional regulator [Mycobacteroides chelonae]OHU50333.1 TetR family transcriptional regulator [Mycobacteroides chelonae]PKQ59440.1 TetR family transcriptional regulator [Mycobacterium sp. MHSD3]SKM77690.1 Putative transcriptional regulator, TetR family [Mycobacteroides abscessus subsp. bolletii]
MTAVFDEGSIPDPDGDSVAARLLDAAEKILADKGIRATTMTDVAEEAGVSRSWLYRHFPDKQTLVGAAIIRLIETSWAQSAAELADIEGLEAQLVAGVKIGRRAYDDPGTLLMRMRVREPEEFMACAGAGVQGLVPDLAGFWRPYLEAARDAGEIHARTDIEEASEWIARVMISLGSVPGNHMDPDDPASLRRHFRRYVLPALRIAPVK